MILPNDGWIRICPQVQKYSVLVKIGSCVGFAQVDEEYL